MREDMLGDFRGRSVLGEGLTVGVIGLFLEGNRTTLGTGLELANALIEEKSAQGIHHDPGREEQCQVHVRSPDQNRDFQQTS